MNGSLEAAIVSVVITCYNQAHFIGEAIQSVLAQTYFNCEIIVVDDGSTDNTPDLVAEYRSIQYIRQANQGVSAARNKGFQESKGRYVVFLDGDDRLLPGAVEAGTRCLEEHPEDAFVFGWCRLITADGLPLPTPRPNGTHSDHYLTLLRSNYIWMPGMVMFQRDIFDRAGGFATSADHSGDYELYLRLARQFSVHCHQETIAEWRQHETNTSRDFALMLKRTLTALHAQKEFVKTRQQYLSAYKSGIKHYQEFYGDQVADEVRASFRERNNWLKAIKGIFVLLRYHPLGLARHTGRRISVTADRYLGKRA